MKAPIEPTTHTNPHMKPIIIAHIKCEPVSHSRNTESDEALRRKEHILSILGRGNIAVFTRPHTLQPELTVTKRVNEWNEDAMGDLKAFSSDGSTDYVCWESPNYTITEEVVSQTKP